jgi:hypothetical protein
MTHREKEELQRLMNDVIEYAENLDDIPDNLLEKLENILEIISDLDLTNDSDDDYNDIIDDSWD